MARSILELDRAVGDRHAIGARGKRHHRHKLASAVVPLPTAPQPPVPASKSINRALVGRSMRLRARAFDAIDVAISGTVAPLRQHSAMTCWATVYTMLANWKNQRSETVESAIADVGPRWSALLAKGGTRGLNAAEKVDFLADAGMVALPPQNPTIERWAQMLRSYGPLWVTTDEAPPNLMIHARVLLAVRGDGSPDGTTLTLIDPGSGTIISERFATFLAKFEAEAGNPNGILRVQVVHWPAGTRAMSVARPRSFSVSPVLFGGTARGAVLSALTEGGVSQAQAERVVAAFEAEVRGEYNRSLSMSHRPRAFQAVDGPAPGVVNPETTAREILEFFYPGRSFANVSADHQRLAAAIFYEALQKQRMLNRLPSVPTNRPGALWLASQAVQTLWREIRGVSDFSTITRNAVALQWRTTLEEIENGLPPTAFSKPRHVHSLSFVEQQGLSDWINNPDIPLSPAVGGISLDQRALEVGDIIVSTTGEAPSIAIRRIGSPVSHAMLYVGGGMVVEAIGEGVVNRSLTEALAHSYVGVAFRHPNITTDQALLIRDYVGQRLGAAYDYDLIVAHARFQLGRLICQQLPEAQRDRCMSLIGPVDIGRGNDGRFICSSLVAEAYENAGVPLLPIPARATNPGDIALSENLVYLGHVKYDPPAGVADRLRRL